MSDETKRREPCTHDMADMDTACADGMCPLCLARECEELRAKCNLWGATHAAQQVSTLKDERDALKARVDALEPLEVALPLIEHVVSLRERAERAEAKVVELRSDVALLGDGLNDEGRKRVRAQTALDRVRSCDHGCECACCQGWRAALADEEPL